MEGLNGQEEKPETEALTETPNEDTVEKPNQQSSEDDQTKQDPDKCPLKKQPANEIVSPSKTKDSLTGTKVKRKARSTRRKLNAMVSNASLHFSDTDSEGELATITPQIRLMRHLSEGQQGPVISITTEESEDKGSLAKESVSEVDSKETLQCNNCVDSLTDVDEIYASEPENETRESPSNLKIAEAGCPAETELEEIDGDEEVQATIYVEPRSDIFCEYIGETITTKEGDGPFSVEVRNKIYLEEVPRGRSQPNAPEIMVLPNTDEEDMTVSDEEFAEEACFNQKEVFEDLDVLAASQIVMKNINKTDNALTVKDVSDDAISDCHTDVEEVEQIE
ncbi:uncharacterized protein LOC116427276 [Nomia melanderi]|uniref:uncharacterized protein LOC116427276 n=1 Tax=Nomia melanderi TaxID=2448451 RepID=UPI00130425C4|nr:uncharacterized protein LOC116427276 [Nomia melanderi]